MYIPKTMAYSNDSSNDYDSSDDAEYELDKDEPLGPNNFGFNADEPIISPSPMSLDSILNLEPKLEVKARIESQKLAELSLCWGILGIAAAPVMWRSLYHFR